MAFCIKTVLISDDIDPVCVQLLQNSGVSVTLKTKWEKGELLTEIEKYEALIVRSATKVTAEVINAGKKLKLIGRAGTGVDNIDLKAATMKGIIVMNTPAGNSKSAAELTCAFISSLARSVPQACASLKNGKWDRKSYMGMELAGKTLAIIGLGRIGREVAEKMQAFGMKTIGFDPIISAEDSAKFNVDWLPLEKIWPVADYITVHVPLIPQTENLINSATFDKCKKGVMVINCARGGIIREADLLTALNDGRCGGAALDVFVEEPPPASLKPLLEHPKLVCTPHLGASTTEAQVRVAQEIAEQIIALNRGTAVIGAINAEAVGRCLDSSSMVWVRAADDASRVAKSLGGFSANLENATVSISAPESLKNLALPLRTGALIGLLGSDANEVNLINAPTFAAARNIQATIDFTNTCEALKVTVAHASTVLAVSTTTSSLGSILLAIGEQALPGVILKDHLLFLKGSVKEIREICDQTGAAAGAFYCGKDGHWQVAAYGNDSAPKLPTAFSERLIMLHF